MKFLLLFSAAVIGLAPVTAFQQPGGLMECRDLSAAFRREAPRGPSSPSEPKAQPSTAAEANEQAEAIRVDTDLVVVDIDVRDKRGAPVTNLAASDFRLIENDSQQTIEIFSFGTRSEFRRRIILVIDHSQSQIPYINTSIDAAKVLVDMLEPNDELAIVTDDIELVSDFSVDRDVLKQRLEGLRRKSMGGDYGKSKQFSALFASLGILFDSGDRRPVVIMQTDGDEFGQLSLGRPYNIGRVCPGLLGRFSDLEDEVLKTRATIFSIIPGVKYGSVSDSERAERARSELAEIMKMDSKQRRGSEMLNEPAFFNRFVKNWVAGRLRDSKAVERLSSISGGSAHYLPDPASAGAVYRRILDEMNQRYILGYYPSNSQDRNPMRKIKVSLRSGLDFSISGKSSYQFTKRR